MNLSIIRYILSRVLEFSGIFMLIPYVVGLIYGEQERYAFLIVGLSCLIVGGIAKLWKPKSKVFYAREGFVTVALSWILLSLTGALPFVLTGEIPFYIDAIFEVVAGYTTSGATIMTDVETLAKCSMFFRLSTHWVGGMGVLVFIMAILPLSGSYNIHLVKAESPGPSVGKLVPKVKNTARILYVIYIVITLLGIICMLFAGANLYESITLMFSAVGTGGFGILNSSVAEYSRAIQIVLLVFMFLCGVNFNMYYLLLIKKPKEVLKSEELRTYIGIILIATLLITLNVKDLFVNVGEAIFHSVFQVVSIMTTTGFSTCDFNLWPSFSKCIIFMIMIVGASAGSTAGGFKVSRLIVSIKSIKYEILKVIHPRSVKKMHLDGRPLTNNITESIRVYLAIYLAIYLVSLLLVSLNGFSFETNASAVMTTFNNVGPGFDMVGPLGNFSAFSPFSKLVFIFDMLAGRLELLPMLVLFSYHTWKK